jgi:HAD superfamily hydrolase (TIGR01490 family)
MNIAIYDLDKTITRRPTFTRFLIFYARRNALARLAALPIWIIALIGYRVGLYGRKPLKQFGIMLFMGRDMSAETLTKTVLEFVTQRVLPDIQPGASKSIEIDRNNGCKLVLATAAPEFYAAEIGARLGFDAIVATRHMVQSGDRTSHLIDGENCYGPEKLQMVSAWFAAHGLKRDDCHVSVYSDHKSDAPLLDWADAGYLVNASAKLRQMAVQKNWHMRDFSANAGH